MKRTPSNTQKCIYLDTPVEAQAQNIIFGTTKMMITCSYTYEYILHNNTI